MACLSKVMRASSRSIGAALLRTSPPALPSVVEDASSNCSVHSRRSRRLMPGAAFAMPREAGDLGLMHRVDHGGRRAGAAERVANIDDVGDAGAFAAELARHRNAHQSRGARGGDRLRRKPRVAIDGDGMFGRDGRDLFGACREVDTAGMRHVACDQLAPRQLFRSGDALYGCGSQIHRRAHGCLANRALIAIRVAQHLLQNFQILVTFGTNWRGSFA